MKRGVDRFSHASLKVGRNGLGLIIWLEMQSFPAELGRFFYRDDVIFHPRHPYIEHLPML